MNFNMRDCVSDDHVESIGEIAKSQSAIIQLLSLENSKLEEQLQQKENIIKDIKSQLDYLETYSSKEDVFEDMKRKLNKIESIVNRK